MATIRERKKRDGTIVFNVQVRLAGGDQITKTWPTKRLAERWAKVEEAKIIEGKISPNAEGRRRTIAQACEKYLEEEVPKKRGGGGMHKAALNYWKGAIGGTKLSDITAALIDKQRAILQVTPFRRANPDSKRTSLKKGEKPRAYKRSVATCNRHVAVLSHLFTVARRQWHWIDRNPLEQLTKLSERGARLRHLSVDERKRLLAETAKDPKLHAFVVIALSTACRAGELLKLDWKDVDLDSGRLLFRWTKNATPRAAWVQGEALKLLEALPTREGRVFPNGSDADGPWEYRKSFKAALAAANVENFRFHDVRHTAATTLARLGASEQQLKAIGGWKSNVVAKYVHLDAGDTRDLTSKLDGELFKSSQP